jgi:hypothetical protein
VGDESKDLHDAGEHDRRSEHSQVCTLRASTGKIGIRHAQATACRGALDGFIAEVIEDHIREHMVDPRAGGEDPHVLAAEELIEIVHQYLKK